MLKQKLKEDVFYFIKMALVYVVLVLVVFLLANSAGEVLQERENLMAAQDEMIPSAMLEFVGMQKLGQFPAKMEVFFVGLMILNIVVLIGIFVHGFSAMRRSFVKSRFSFFFMQIMPLWKNYVLWAGEILLTGLLGWAIYIFVVGIFGGMLTADMYVDDGVLFRALLEYMGARGISLALFVTALGMFFGLALEQRFQPVDLGLGLTGVSFVLGNLYKIPQYIGYTQVQQMVNAQETMETMRALKELRILCPFAWLNPINIYNGILDSKELWVYLLLAVLLLVAGGLWYCKRDWKEV